MSTTSQKLRSLLKILVLNIIVALGILSAFELTIHASLNFPQLTKHLPDSLLYYPVKIYTDLDRNVTREFSRWDKELSYTLQPDISARHQNHEFDTLIKTNKLGLRDDNASLISPDIIALGDSFTMGFGVNQDNTYPQVIEHKTNFKVLNTGIESYGTAREVLSLKRLDTTQLKFLIVQYCPNDIIENLSFVENYGRLKTMRKKKYDETLKQYLSDTHYYFGKYLRFLMANIKKPSIPYRTDEEMKIINRTHAQLFIKSLAKAPIDLSNVQIIVFDLIDEHDSYLLRYNPHFKQQQFISYLKQELAKDKYPDYIKKIIVVDTSTIIGKESRFILDGHINATGHRQIADNIIPYLQ
jgi:hypothetical protein